LHPLVVIFKTIHTTFQVGTTWTQSTFTLWYKVRRPSSQVFRLFTKIKIYYFLNSIFLNDYFGTKGNVHKTFEKSALSNWITSRMSSNIFSAFSKHLEPME
jgi:hypothetical protein